MDERNRCPWARGGPLMVAYHDDEWGVPLHDERHLFELLVLEGAQAGLSWSTVLGKRERYRQVFAGFDPAAVAAFGDAEIEALLADPGIVRNRAKVGAAVGNARAVLGLWDGGESLDGLLWGFVGGRTRQNAWTRVEDLPPETAESRAMSRELKRRGFRFVGPTICYALMQSAGLVNDHLVTCFRYAELGGR
jgi:DNA-3-methyladenine glycosylase I